MGLRERLSNLAEPGAGGGPVPGQRLAHPISHLPSPLSHLPSPISHLPPYLSPVQPIEAVRWSADGGAVRIIDQRRLPAEYVERDLRTLDEVVDAIRTLAVRGAPAIGICGAMGLVVSLGDSFATADALRQQALAGAARLRATPHGGELGGRSIANWPRAGRWRRARGARRHARRSHGDPEEDRVMCRRIGEVGAILLPDGARSSPTATPGLATGASGSRWRRCSSTAGRRFLLGWLGPLAGSRLTVWERTPAFRPL